MSKSFSLRIAGIIVLTALSMSAIAQSSFQRCYGGTKADYIDQVIQTKDGGFALAGSTWSYGDGMEQFYMIKTNAWGDTLWTSVVGGPSYTGGVYSLVQCSDNGYLITTSEAYYTLFEKDVFAIKFDQNGHLLWTKTLGKKNNITDMIKTTGGDYILLGSDSIGLFLFKTDPSLNTIWQNYYTYGSAVNTSILQNMQETKDHGFIFFGTNRHSTTPIMDAIVITRADSNGNMLWSKEYQTGLQVELGSIHQNKDQGYLISASYLQAGGNASGSLLVRTNAAGDTIWTRAFNTPLDFSIYKAEETVSGSFLASGYTSNFGAGGRDGFLIKLKASGDSLWTRTFGGSQNDYLYRFQSCTDGGIILGGQTQSYGVGASDMYLVKTDSLGLTGTCSGGHAAVSRASYPLVAVAPSFWQAMPYSSSAINVNSQVYRGGQITNICTSEGVQEQEPESFLVRLFPNPSEGIFTLSSDQPIQSVSIFDLPGNKIRQETVTGREITINLSGMPRGLYFCNVQTVKGWTANRKIIIQ
jgi:hypothetical protein